MKLTNHKTADVTKEMLNSQVWDDELDCTCYGYAVKIRSSLDGYLDSLRANMPGNFEIDLDIKKHELEPHLNIFLTQTSDNKSVFFFYDLRVEKLKFQYGYETFEENLQFLSDLLGAFNAARNEKFIVLHAGAVSFMGKSIILPADSYSGKSTLTASFVKCGAKYFSDEYAVISEEGVLYPFPKPISMREPGGWDQTDVSVESLGGENSTLPMKIDYVLFTKYRKYARWNPQQLSKARGAFELLPHALNGQNNPEFTVRVLQNAVKTATILQSGRGDSMRFVKKFMKLHEIQA